LGLINAKSHASLFPAGRGFCSSSDPHAPPRHENLLAVPIAVHDWAKSACRILALRRRPSCRGLVIPPVPAVYAVL